MLIDIENAKPGMTLLEDVLLPNGAILLHANQSLTESLIEILKKRGIRKIQIVSETKPNITDKATLHPDISDSSESENHQKEKKETPPSLPKLRLIIKDDLMSAKLCIEPTEAPNQILTVDEIVNFLHSNGIEHGINKKAISDTIEKWKKHKRYYEIDNVAVGTLPIPAKEGNLEFKVKYLSNVSEIEKVKQTKYYSDLPKDLPLQRVDEGDIIAVRDEDTPMVPGRNIKNELIETKELIKLEISLDPNVTFSSDRKQLISKITGFAYFLDNRIVGVIPFNFDAGIEITISSDRMKADMILHAPGFGGKDITLSAINNILSEQKIIYGIKDEVLNKILENISNGNYPSEPITIAEGLMPKNGENGTIKFLFNTETSLKPKLNKDGTVDYKNLSIVETVTKGQELAILIPPTKGTSGKDIFGKEIPATDGKPTKLPAGPNTMIHPQKPDVLIAATDGNVRYNGTNVEVSEGYVIKGDVDFSTGNIKYPKSIIVSGDIKSGFKIECGGDLQVSGTIEDSEIIVEGNVLCKLGFIGQGKGIINAKGDVNILFIKNQTVKSKQNITIAKEAINSNLFAKKSITIHGNPLSIAGGSLIARDSITAFTIGNMSGIKTLIEVGKDYTLIEEMEKTDSQIAELLENRKKLLLTYQKYEKAQKMNIKISAKEEFLLSKLKTTLAKYEQQIRILEERKKTISEKMYNLNSCFIRIEHSAKPGTIFKIGQRHFLVKDEIIGPKNVRYINEEIRII
jgi:uncharacterized protein (DUF342 family)